MNYELAKELREAGFPQHPYNAYCGCGAKTINDPHYPTLEELIAACGDDFREVSMTTLPSKRWHAKGVNVVQEDAYYVHSYFHGSTPTEAVASLLREGGGKLSDAK